LPDVVARNSSAQSGNPHPETVDLADAGLEDWTADLPADEGLVDVTAGTAVRWIEGKGG